MIREIESRFSGVVSRSSTEMPNSDSKYRMTPIMPVEIHEPTLDQGRVIQQRARVRDVEVFDDEVTNLILDAGDGHWCPHVRSGCPQCATGRSSCGI